MVGLRDHTFEHDDSWSLEGGHGSFKQAADELAVMPTAVSHQIRSLEAHLGLPLFVRQIRQVALTDAGAQLYPVLHAGFDAFEAVVARLVRASPRERVTITATNAFTAKWLMPLLGQFHARHPEIDLHLHASDDVVDLGDPGFDLAVRYGRGPYPGLQTDVMFADEYAPVVNPLLKVGGADALQSVPLIHFDWKRTHALNPTWARWFAQAGLAPTSPPHAFRYSDEGHAIQAAVAGQGIALLSLALVAEELAAGHLVQPFGPRVAGHTYHLAMRANLPPRAAVRVVADWLRSAATPAIV